MTSVSTVFRWKSNNVTALILIFEATVDNTSLNLKLRFVDNEAFIQTVINISYNFVINKYHATITRVVNNGSSINNFINDWKKDQSSRPPNNLSSTDDIFTDKTSV